jgi:membrane protein required for colicin V production
MGLTSFDWAVAAILLLSGLLGFARGATREVTTVIALILAAVLAIFGLRFTGPIAHRFISTLWMANVAAVLALFLVAYLLLRLLGGVLTRGVRATPLSGVDRGLGFGLGLLRGALVVGVAAVILHAVTPAKQRPVWFTNALLLPLADGVGDGLKAFAPKGVAFAKAEAPLVEHAVLDGSPPTETVSVRPKRSRGYTDVQRKGLDDLVEKSR